MHNVSNGVFLENIVPCYKRSNSYSYLAFNVITRYQSMQDLLHVIHSNCICLECNILSFPISSTLNHALVSETRRPRAAAAYTLHRNCVIILPLISLTPLLSQISLLIHQIDEAWVCVRGRCCTDANLLDLKFSPGC